MVLEESRSQIQERAQISPLQILLIEQHKKFLVPSSQVNSFVLNHRSKKGVIVRTINSCIRHDAVCKDLQELLITVSHGGKLKHWKAKSFNPRPDLFSHR